MIRNMPEATCTSFPAMGSDCVLHLFEASAEIAASAEAEVVRIEDRYSRYRPDSLLSEINRVAAVGGALDVDDETAALLDYALAVHRKSEGAFDITTGILRRVWNFSSGRLPKTAAVDQLMALVGLEKVQWRRPRLSFPVRGMELDFGGIAKEYAADRAAAICAEAGTQHGLIDLGGDLRAIGPRADGTPWLIHLRDPRRPGARLAVIPLTHGGLATSGDYERCVVIDGRRYSHILDPRTGWPVHGLASVTVIAESCLVAGSLATIAMLKGNAGAAWLQQLGIPCVWGTADGQAGGSLWSATPAIEARN